MPVIAHVDMDAFYASIEQRDDPALRGRPVIVGGSGRRGVVAAASYEARRFGIHSAMPSFQAKRRCPDAIFVPPRIGHYAAVSAELMAILDRYSPTVEPLSLDEAFLDLTGTERLFGSPRGAAARIRDEIHGTLGLTASVGVGSSRLVAKIASDFDKPDGLTVVDPGEEREFLAPMPAGRIPGVGPKAQDALARVGIRTIDDIARCPPDALRRALGRYGAVVQRLARGEDPRRVRAGRQRQSLGSERTLADDICGRDAVRARLVPLADEVARGLRAKGVRAGGVRVKVKYATFRTITRERHLDRPAADSASLLAAADLLLRRFELELPIRLVGMTAYDLDAGDQPRQASLLTSEDAPRAERAEAVERALDAVREKFGAAGVRRGTAVPTPKPPKDPDAD